jgi:hypothetical protein
VIARFHIVTPHRLLVAPQDMPQPAEFDYQGCRFRVHPPFAAQLDPKDLDPASEVRLTSFLRRQAPPIHSRSVQLND